MRGVRQKRWLAASVVLAAALAAQGELVIPDKVPVTREDEQAIRAMLGAYVAAVHAGDRDKAMSFAHLEEKDHEKVTRLGVEIDFAIERLRSAVEKKLGKDAWGKLGDMLGEMTPEGMKTLAIKPTPSIDEVKVNWGDQTTVPADKRLGGDVTVRRIKERGAGAWKFQLIDDNSLLVPARRWLRDAIAEINDLAANVEAGTIDKAKLGKEVERLVKELKGPEPAPDVQIEP